MNGMWWRWVGLVILVKCTVWQGMGAVSTPTDGDWAAQQVELAGTPEAALMVRVGDIDNLGFGWPTGFDPFTGLSTPRHNFPWTPSGADWDGTDRIMVITSYAGRPPSGFDGYTSSTKRPDNAVRAVEVRFTPLAVPVTDAAFQIFVDDFQAPVWRASYRVTLNGQVFAPAETVLNSLTQTGPIGKLVTVEVPRDLLGEVASGRVLLLIDDPSTGAGDGYALDFVKLLLNRTGVLPAGKVVGSVTDAVSGRPVAGARVASFDRTVTTDAAGGYTLTEVPAGLAVVQVDAVGYQTARRTVDVLVGQTARLDVPLARAEADLSIYWAVELEFFGHLGQRYQLQYSGDLKTWLADETIEGGGQLVSRLRSTRLASQRYWRVVSL